MSVQIRPRLLHGDVVRRRAEATRATLAATMQAPRVKAAATLAMGVASAGFESRQTRSTGGTPGEYQSDPSENRNKVFAEKKGYSMQPADRGSRAGAQWAGRRSDVQSLEQCESSGYGFPVGMAMVSHASFKQYLPVSWPTVKRTRAPLNGSGAGIEHLSLPGPLAAGSGRSRCRGYRGNRQRRQPAVLQRAMPRAKSARSPGRSPLLEPLLEPRHGGGTAARRPRGTRRAT